MQQRHESILRAINNDSKSYNILTFPTHEAYQSNWATMPHTFYLYQGEGIKPWSNKYRQLPENHVLLDGSDSQVKYDMKFDIVLSQNKFGQYQVARKIADGLNLPLVSIEHTLPFVGWNQKHLSAMTKMRGDLNLFISEYSVNKWGFDKNDPSVRIIHHGIDTNRFKPNDTVVKQEYALAVCNDLKNRQWCCGYEEWLRLVENFPNKIVGDNPGLSKPADSLEELVSEYNKALVFVSTTLVSPVPTVVLEAMSCGLPVIVLDNCMLPEVVKDGYNGFISNDINYLRDKLAYLLINPDIALDMGRNARKTIQEKFSLDFHLEQWKNIFHEVYGKGIICRV